MLLTGPPPAPTNPSSLRSSWLATKFLTPLLKSHNENKSSGSQIFSVLIFTSKLSITTKPRDKEELIRGQNSLQRLSLPNSLPDFLLFFSDSQFHTGDYFRNTTVYQSHSTLQGEDLDLKPQVVPSTSFVYED